MARDQHVDAVPPLARDRRQQMLSVPEREDDWHVGFAARINVGRLQRETRGRSDKAQIFRGGDSDRRLSPSLSTDVPP
jgi:hypothetical protein